MNLEKDQKHLKTYTSFLFEAGQEVQGMYHSLNHTILQFNFSLNHLTKPQLLMRKHFFLLVECPVSNIVLFTNFLISYLENHMIQL